MPGIRPATDVPDLDDPVFVEGLPGVGLVGKIAVDHLVAAFEMRHVANVDCNGLPEVAVYGTDERDLNAPVRIYADPDRDLLALQSDVPVSRTAAPGFADCVTGWIEEKGAFPAYLSGLATEDQGVGEVPPVCGVATGDAGTRLDDLGLDRPGTRGAVGGPTGALLRAADRRDLDAAGLIVETDPRFPDPAAARRILVEGVGPLAGVEVPTDELVDRAEEIQDQREGLAERMREAGEEESSQAQPLRGFQ